MLSRDKARRIAVNRELISFCTGIGFYEPFRQPPPSSAKNSQNFIAELRAVALNLQLSATASKGDLACSGNHCGACSGLAR